MNTGTAVRNSKLPFPREARGFAKPSTKMAAWTSMKPAGTALPLRSRTKYLMGPLRIGLCIDIDYWLLTWI